MTHRIRNTIVAFLIGLALTPSAMVAQEAGQVRFQPSLTSQPQVQEALRWLERHFPEQVQEWIRITEIPAPSTLEQARGRYVAAEMEKEGLEVTIDRVGNVIGRRPGSGSGPTLVFAAHIDTVHPLSVDVSVIRDGDTLRAPGVFDNSASVANMLAVIRALNRAGLKTQGDLIFIGTTQEELGLKGMIHWLDENPGVTDMLIAMDGGLGAISYGALGIYWTRFSFLGDGAHTNQSTGRPHPVRALSEAVARIYELEVPEGQGGAVYNVGMLEGGSVFNAIPERASFTVDLRSVNPALLDSLQTEIESRVAEAAAAHGVQWVAELVNRMPAGGTEADLADRRGHPLVTTAEAVYGSLGLGDRVVASGSTDANAGVVRGIPSIAVGRSLGGDQHTLSEWADIPSALPATQAILLLAVSLAGLTP
jgi:acetylornithine deacetylase/succinyl-diaminopimelate desuccinylase-like protein